MDEFITVPIPKHLYAQVMQLINRDGKPLNEFERNWRRARQIAMRDHPRDCGCYKCGKYPGHQFAPGYSNPRDSGWVRGV